MKTDDPVRDFERHDAEQTEALKKRPQCSVCGEHIQEDMAYYIHDEWVCDDCVSWARKVVPDGR